MCIQLEIAYSCGAVLHKFDRCGFPILSNGNCPRGASRIPMLSHDTECDFAQHDHGGSGILKQHFLQIDREDYRPLTKMIHSGSPIRALVSRTEPADFVLLVLEHVELLSTAPQNPVLNVQRKRKRKRQSFECSYSYGRVLDTFEDH
jgi:hypothetical protein